MFIFLLKFKITPSSTCFFLNFFLSVKKQSWTYGYPRTLSYTQGGADAGCKIYNHRSRGGSSHILCFSRAFCENTTSVSDSSLGFLELLMCSGRNHHLWAISTCVLQCDADFVCKLFLIIAKVQILERKLSELTGLVHSQYL